MTSNNKALLQHSMFSCQLGAALTAQIKALGGTDDTVRAALTNTTFLEQAAQLACALPISEEVLPDGHYRIPILSDILAQRKRLGVFNADLVEKQPDDYKNWEQAKSPVNLQPGTTSIMCVKALSREVFPHVGSIPTDLITQWAEKNGYREATMLEGICFAIYCREASIRISGQYIAVTGSYGYRLSDSSKSNLGIRLRPGDPDDTETDWTLTFEQADMTAHRHVLLVRI